MGKRFTDTDKWKKGWIKNLKPEHKLFWIYLLDECTNAGIWHVEFDIANMRLGINITKNEVLEAFKGKIIEFDNQTKWFIPAFIKFQYGELRPDCKPHKPVIVALTQNNLFHYLQKNKDYPKGIYTLKEKEKEKDKEKEKEKEFSPKQKFEEIYREYPKKVGKQGAYQAFTKSVKNEDDFNNIKNALKNYKKHLDLETWRKPKDACRWFRGDFWQDWINFKEELKKDDAIRRAIIRD